MQVPFSETDRVDSPASLYAATKRSCELLAGVYNSIYNVSTTGLRFFTVYGPWGRPDMAALAFAHKITAGHPVKVFQSADGKELARDFTYIDDIVEVSRALFAAVSSISFRIHGICTPITPRNYLLDFYRPSRSGRSVGRVARSVAEVPFKHAHVPLLVVQGILGALDTAKPGEDRIFNLGNTHPHTVSELVSGLETALEKTAVRHYVDLPNLGDVLQTHSNISAATAAFNYSPQVDSYLCIP